MTRPHSDALVFFGATGDLAYKKIFPALHAMVKRVHLNVPVVVCPFHQCSLKANRSPRAADMDAYERVLGAAMEGDAALFAREDYVEEAWRIVDPVLGMGTPIYPYQQKTWGPPEVERVIPPGGWSNPTSHDASSVASGPGA